MNLTHIYVGNLGDYIIPEVVAQAAGVTSARSVWDRRFSAAKRLSIWGEWMDRCEISKAIRGPAPEAKE